ncbi:MAG: F0F1 ATP synthase subunit A [Acidobacteriota bacterium]
MSHVVPHPIKKIEIPFEHDIFAPGGIITVLSDQIVIMILGALLLCLAFPAFARRRQGKGGIDALVPSGFGSFVEMVCEYWRKDVAEAHLGPYAPRFIRFIWSTFFFVLTMNLMGLLPLAAISPVVVGLPIGGTPTGNIWVTATMAGIVLFMMVFNGLRFGGKDYLAHFAPGPRWMAPFMVFIEVVGTFGKAVALALRLFANMVSGHVLLAVLIIMILKAGTTLGPVVGLSVVIPLVIGAVAVTMLEIFVAFLQAFIFTYLTTLFIGLSVNLHHDEAH